jgi:hypothetical protein
MSIHNKRNQITVIHEKLTSNYNDSSISFLYYNGKNTIHTLDLASGLIQLLIENKFTLQSLLNTSPSELSKTLGIDEEVATLICKAAKSKKSPNRLFGGRTN